MWVMIAEIFPLKVRGVGMGVGSVVLWAATFAITFVFPVMDSDLGLAYSAWIFGAVSVVLFVLVRWRVPETKGRSLEQIEMDLRGADGQGSGSAVIPARQRGRAAADTPETPAP